MTVSLIDISTATAAYLENEVEVRIGQVTGNLQPGEEGTFTVRVTNPEAPGGVRLVDLTLHILVAPDSVAQLIPPTGVTINARTTADTSDPLLGNDDRIPEMFVFFNGTGEFDAILDVGEVLELEFRYQAASPGDATLSCHVHASVDLDALFPRSAGPNGEKSLTVIR